MKHPIGQKGSRIPPFSLRLTFGERARLERNAGNMPLGSYIKSLLLKALGVSTNGTIAESTSQSFARAVAKPRQTPDNKSQPKRFTP